MGNGRNTVVGYLSTSKVVARENNLEGSPKTPIYAVKIAVDGPEKADTDFKCNHDKTLIHTIVRTECYSG